MKHRVLAALCAACLLLGACGAQPTTRAAGQGTDLPASEGAEQNTQNDGQTADEPETEPAPGGEPAAEWQAYPLKCIGYSGETVCAVPGGFVSATREVAPEPDETGNAWVNWQLYYTDTATRVSQKIEGATVPVEDEFFDEGEGFPFYAGGRVYLLLKYALYSFALDGGDMREEYRMEYPPWVEGQVYQRWGGSFYTDGLALYFTSWEDVNLDPEGSDLGMWYTDTTPEQLVRLDLRTGEAEVMLQAFGDLFLYTAQGARLYAVLRTYETDFAQFYNESYQLVDTQGRGLAHNEYLEQLVAIDTDSGEQEVCDTFSPDDARRLLVYSRVKQHPPMYTEMVNETDDSGLWYLNADGGWQDLPGYEQDVPSILFSDQAYKSMLVYQEAGFDEDTGHIFDFYVQGLDGRGGLTEWTPVGLRSYAWANIPLWPCGSAGEYYVVEADVQNKVGYVENGTLVLSEADPHQPGSEIDDQTPFVIVYTSVYQLILKEDYWNGNANLLPITVL